MAFSGRKHPEATPGFRVAVVTLNDSNISAKQLKLPAAPLFPASVFMLLADGGGHRTPGEAFSVDGDTVSWAGKSLDSELERDDELTLVYT